MPARILTSTIEQRFWSKVEKRGSDECWPWTGFRAKSGHGQLGKGGRGDGQILAHVYSFLLADKCLPPTLCVLHTCDNGWCVNPAHLYAGTKAQNLKDAWDRNRRKKKALTLQQVAEIRAVPRGWGICKGLAEQYGVTLGTIYQIRDRSYYRAEAAA